jgi:hypothetical protein
MKDEKIEKKYIVSKDYIISIQYQLEREEISKSYKDFKGLLYFPSV